MKLGMVWLLLLIPVVWGLPLCEDTPQISSNCVMVTPQISCDVYNYSIMNTSGGVVELGNLSQLNQSVYYFDFNLTEGEFVIRLCDGGVREVVVAEDEFTMLAVAIVLTVFGAVVIFIGYHIVKSRSEGEHESE